MTRAWDLFGNAVEASNDDPMARQMEDVCGELPFYPEDPPQHRWKSADGKVHVIADMSTAHIVNAMRYMVRNKMSTLPHYTRFQAELVRRGEEDAIK